VRSSGILPHTRPPPPLLFSPATFTLSAVCSIDTLAWFTVKTPIVQLLLYLLLIGSLSLPANALAHVEQLGVQTPNVYRYTGEQWDPDLGMYYLRARYYQPDIGRFWTINTFEGHPTDPISLHKYLYAHANPVMNIDPSGHAVMVGGLSDLLGGLGGRGILEGIRLPAINMARAKAVAKLGVFAAAAATTLTGDSSHRSNNRMRLQLQEGVNHFWSLPMFAPPSIGVSSTQVRAGLTAMHVAAVGDTMLLPLPNALEPQLFSAIVFFSQKLTPIVAGGGVIQGGNVLREEFVGGGKVYRIDLENLRGHNLRQ
jgi:RHS repeat-associated protein